MPVFSSKMTLFGKAGLYTIIGMVSVVPCQVDFRFPALAMLAYYCQRLL